MKDAYNTYVLTILCPPLPLQHTRWVYDTPLTALDVGLFDKNTALTQLYV
jgi:hypothetical protein